jgi:hypothetical protein
METGDFDPHYLGFLEQAERQAEQINAASDCAGLMPGGRVQGHATRYAMMLRGIEHYEKQPGQEPYVSDDPIFLGFHFPPDYLRSDDPTLHFRVVHVLSPVHHPNASGVNLCLGESFRPGTPLRALVHHLWAVFAAGRFSTTSPLSREAAEFYVANIDRVRALRARPLFRESFVTSVQRVEPEVKP